MKNQILVLLAITFIAGCGRPEIETNDNSQKNKTLAENKASLIVAVGKVEPENEIVKLSAQSGGIVKSVNKKDGDKILQGELLVQLDDDIEQSKINEKRMQIQSQRNQIDIEESQLREAEINLFNKKSLFSKNKRLVETGAETQQGLDDLATEIKVLEVSLEGLKAKIQLANNKLNELIAQLKTVEMEAEKKRFKAPDNGILLDITVNNGESVDQYATYAEFASKGSLIVRAEVDELFSSQVKIGQKVEIVYTGSDKIIATGEILMVSPYLKKKSLFSEKANDQEDRRVREIRISIKDGSNLIINSKVECKIKL
jgi:multidrug resistance efflux pump